MYGLIVFHITKKLAVRPLSFSIIRAFFPLMAVEYIKTRYCIALMSKLDTLQKCRGIKQNN